MMDMKMFYTGNAFDAYEYLGCHVEEDGTVVFRTYAPNAESVSLIGDFNEWKDTPMERVCDGTVWECRIDEDIVGKRYKYRIYRKNNGFLDHCDPYGYGMELRPGTCSVVRETAYTWNDETWIEKRTDCKKGPLNIYEVHAGSWKTNRDDENGWYQYQELAKIMIPYLKENGYNYVEFMPLAEHPCDNSWGYQETGFFAATSRYGTVQDLKEMVDLFHQNNIGCILDFVPVHFAVDDYALAEYDGTAIYEYPHPDVGYSEWGSRNFNHSKGEVSSFLISCADYWIKECHFDGLRMDAISNLIYWQGNAARGENDRSIQFIRNMNKIIKGRHPGIILAAEDSSSYGGVTKPVYFGGLGFDYKWDMGWMNDTLKYFQTHPYDRKRDYHKLTFSMMYFYSENFIMPFSHDEVVHGKATILQKMYGEYEGKFPQARALYLYMFAHPGKKLNFMGNELGQLREWDEKREQDWDILKYPNHDAFHHFMKDLNLAYLDHSAFYEKDFEADGFRWIDCHQEQRVVYVFERRSEKERLLFVFNFSDVWQRDYTLVLESGKVGKKIIDTNLPEYGGNASMENVLYQIGHVMTMNIAPYSGVCYVVENE